MDLVLGQGYMDLALKLARTRKGVTAPNPAVGAILVKNGEVIGEGCHWAAGKPHAEAVAIENAKGSVNGATLYVTLEPCNHVGRTPACTELIRTVGITRVVYGHCDPNPHVCGGGAAILKASGLLVEKLESNAVTQFYQSYNWKQKTGLPWLCLKWVTSLDGKIAGPSGQRVKLSGPELDSYTHLRRREADAILTTARTVINDNPRLDARSHDTVPKRVFVLDSRLSLLNHPELKLFNTSSEVVLISSRSDCYAKIRNIPVPAIANGLNLEAAIQAIGRDGVCELWVEAGAFLATSLWKEGLWNEVVVGISPKYLGGDAFDGPKGIDFSHHRLEWKSMGSDVMCRVERNY